MEPQRIMGRSYTGHSVCYHSLGMKTTCIRPALPILYLICMDGKSVRHRLGPWARGGGKLRCNPHNPALGIFNNVKYKQVRKKVDSSI